MLLVKFVTVINNSKNPALGGFGNCKSSQIQPDLGKLNAVHPRLYRDAKYETLCYIPTKHRTPSNHDCTLVQVQCQN